VEISLEAQEELGLSPDGEKTQFTKGEVERLQAGRPLSGRGSRGGPARGGRGRGASKGGARGRGVRENSDDLRDLVLLGGGTAEQGEASRTEAQGSSRAAESDEEHAEDVDME